MDLVAEHDGVAGFYSCSLWNKEVEARVRVGVVHNRLVVRDNMVPVEVQQGGIRNKQAQKIFGTGRHFRIMGSYVFRPVSPFFCKA